MADAFNKYFDNLQVIFEEVLKIKNGNSADRKSNELAEKRKYGSLLFVLMKNLSRMMKYKVCSGREELHSAKLNVDSKRLHLQNLLYEVNHLKREVRYCLQFKSQDEDIDLLPEEEYLSVVKPKLRDNTAHAKRMGRLEWELSLRKQKAAYYNELLNRKKQVVQDSVLKMESLTSLQPSLRSLFKATKPLQDALQIPAEREWNLAQLVQLLPQPLYMCYMNIHALGLSDSSIRASVIGEEEDVLNMDINIQEDKLRRSTRHKNEDCETVFRKAYSSDDEASESMPGRQNRALEPHPLIVTFTIGNDKVPQECLTVNLRYLQHLGFVTASTAINLSHSDGYLGEVTAAQDILKYLYNNDSGNVISVSKTHNELKNVNMSEAECIEYLNEKQLGRPYTWAQRMCGIEVFSENKETAQKAEHQQRNIPEIMKCIQNFWNSRLNLIKQLRSLVNKNIDLYLKDEVLPLIRPSCSLVQWSSVDWDEYAASRVTSIFRENAMVDDSHLFYRAVVVRGSAKMECLISISSKFPADNPIWAISIYWNGQHNAVNSSAIKLMEQWTNSLMQCEVKHPLALLSAQLMRTMYSFDIFLETEGPLYSPIEYNREKHYINAFAKRIRAQPYRYIKGNNINTFKQ